jgi:hypothetical protein
MLIFQHVNNISSSNSEIKFELGEPQFFLKSLRTVFGSRTEPSFFVVAMCFVLMLCAHALCFVLRAHALCLSGFLVTTRQAGSTKHEACARAANYDQKM